MEQLKDKAYVYNGSTFDRIRVGARVRALDEKTGEWVWCRIKRSRW